MLAMTGDGGEAHLPGRGWTLMGTLTYTVVFLFLQEHQHGVYFLPVFFFIFKPFQADRITRINSPKELA